MVRTMVGTLVEIGKGRSAPTSLDEILAARDRSAPDHGPGSGLYLSEVGYPEALLDPRFQAGHPTRGDPMKFFIDTANLDEIRDAKSMGVLDGVTTNPSLMAKEGRKDTDALLKEICDIVEGPVSGEVVALDAAGMIAEGKRLAAVSEYMVVKIPMTLDGLKACRALADEGIPVNMTLCFSASQALLAAKPAPPTSRPFVAGWTTSAATACSSSRTSSRCTRTTTC